MESKEGTCFDGSYTWTCFIPISLNGHVRTKPYTFAVVMPAVRLQQLMQQHQEQQRKLAWERQQIMQQQVCVETGDHAAQVSLSAYTVR